MLAAGRSGHPGAEAALAALCQTYWRPLYGYVRRRGHSVEDAQDLTQAFFVRFVEKRFFKHARRERGRFRSFLLASLKYFLANEWDRANTLKRGRAVLDFDFAAAELVVAAAADSDPEWLFERHWVQHVLSAAIARVKEEYTVAGQLSTFQLLKCTLDGGRADSSYGELAERMGISAVAARVAAHRLRRRYRTSLRAVVGQTVRDPSTVDDEIRYLLSVMDR